MLGFDSTYEGLKQEFPLVRAQLLLGFDSTYEGLKRDPQWEVLVYAACFDSTYEGLKLKSLVFGVGMRKSVSTVPMRA